MSLSFRAGSDAAQLRNQRRAGAFVQRTAVFTRVALQAGDRARDQWM